MFKVSWITATKAQETNLIDRAGERLETGPLAIKPESLKVHVGRLAHYGDGVRLIRFSGHLAMAPSHSTILYALDTGATLSLLLGGSDAIHAINGEIEFVVTADNVLDYLRFFCFFVRGENGPFYLIGDDADTLLPQEVRATDVSQATNWPNATLADVIAPPALVQAKDDGTFTCAALVYYHTAIYASGFTVFPGGFVHMDDDQMLAKDVPKLAEVEV